MKLLIIFDPAHYEAGASVTPLLVPDDLDIEYENMRMFDQYEPNHCKERLEDFLRDKCGAVDVYIDIFDIDKGCLKKIINLEP